jgi:hypothetical protein
MRIQIVLIFNNLIFAEKSGYWVKYGFDLMHKWNFNTGYFAS